MEITAEERVSDAIVEICMHNPFIASVLLGLGIKEDPSIPTLCTDYRCVYYNPTYIEKFTESQLEFVLVHEASHVAFGHMHRYEDMKKELKKDPKYDKIIDDEGLNESELRTLWNDACDLAINQLYRYEYGYDVPPDALLAGVRPYEDIHLYGRERAENYMLRILDEIKIVQTAHVKLAANGNQAGNSDTVGNTNGKDHDTNKEGKGGDTNPSKEDKAEMDDRAGDGIQENERKTEPNRFKKDNVPQFEPVSEDDNEGMQMLAEIVARALETAHNAGQGSVKMYEEIVGFILEPAPINWRAELQQFMKKVTNRYLSYRKPNRRHQSPNGDIIWPVRRNKDLGTVAFLSDMSGSMDTEKVMEGYCQMERIWREYPNVSIEFIAFDGKVLHEETMGAHSFPLPDSKKIRYGSGGTSFQPALDAAMKHKNVLAIIMLTDMYAFDSYQNPGVPTLFLTVVPCPPGSSHDPGWGKIREIE